MSARDFDAYGYGEMIAKAVTRDQDGSRYPYLTVAGRAAVAASMRHAELLAEEMAAKFAALDARLQRLETATHGE